MNSTSTASMVDVGSSFLTTVTSPPQLTLNHGAQAHLVPLPSHEGCGHTSFLLSGRIGERGTRGGPRKWEAQAGESRERDRRKSCLVLVIVIFPPP